MKVLVVAHPDDEALWFAPENYDLILIAFCERSDYPGFGGRRLSALKNHPLKDRIRYLRIDESNYWRDKTQEDKHLDNYNDLCKILRTVQADSVDTHSANGEYGHADHILVHNACMDTLDCPVNGKDPAMYRAIRKAYQDAGCWTWQ